MSVLQRPAKTHISLGTRRQPCTDPESYVRGGPNVIKFLFVCLFLVEEGIEDPNTAINGPSSACQRNAI